MREGGFTGSLRDLLGDGPATTLIDALEPTLTFAFDHRAFRALCERYAELTRAALRFTEALYARTTEREHDLLALSASERHAKWLAAEPALDPRIKRRHLASYLGISPEHLHAAGHGGNDFARIAARFAGRQRLVTLDFPGHGASDPDRLPASARRYAALLDGVVHELGLGPRVVLGNSIGGAAAAIHASRHREQVRGLVLVSSGGFDRAPQGLIAQWAMRHIARHMARGAKSDPHFAGWFARYYARVLPEPAARASRDAIVRSGYELAPVLHEAWRSFARPDADLRPLLPTLTMPVLVAWAKGDRLLPWRRSAPALTRLADLRVRTFAGGHAPFLEVPDAFEPELAAFLERVCG